MKKNCDACKWGDVQLEAKEAPCKICCAGSHFEAYPQTNGDRFRAMTDEELATWLNNRMASTSSLYENTQSKEEWLDWLKQEAEE